MILKIWSYYGRLHNNEEYTVYFPTNHFELFKPNATLVVLFSHKWSMEITEGSKGIHHYHTEAMWQCDITVSMPCVITQRFVEWQCTTCTLGGTKTNYLATDNLNCINFSLWLDAPFNARWWNSLGCVPIIMFLTVQSQDSLK